MDRFKRAVLLTAMAENLRKKGSWCGETHLQKATFFLQELQKVPIGFDFILYKHGPFSFQLRDELTSIRADGLFQLHQHWPYGPASSLPKRVGPYVSNIRKRWSGTEDN